MACGLAVGHDVGVVLMVGLGVLLVIGVMLTLLWASTGYVAASPHARPGERTEQLASDRIFRSAERRYLRGAAVAIVGGVWAGALVTGPAIRLIMRLLAVTAGDDAQGRLTEAEATVGRIELGGTVFLYVGGIAVGLMSGFVYVLIRRWLPSSPLAGVAFGALHLVLVATTVDPLRPDNSDFDIVGPGWLW